MAVSAVYKLLISLAIWMFVMVGRTHGHLEDAAKSLIGKSLGSVVGVDDETVNVVNPILVRDLVVRRPGIEVVTVTMTMCPMLHLPATSESPRKTSSTTSTIEMTETVVAVGRPTVSESQLTAALAPQATAIPTSKPTAAPCSSSRCPSTLSVQSSSGSISTALPSSTKVTAQSVESSSAIGVSTTAAQSSRPAAPSHNTAPHVVDVVVSRIAVVVALVGLLAM